ncbi:hypothetical protein DMH04_12265 [Kibdelosporangium aridum]|uniref:Nucleotidyltransferase n=1 Tax=Kibdelosporangium aridum TaxID=2030 RepID=A0A428ZG76_KIBAR|nr:hypothetical protein [Kibdelosporangium aridum]RSM87074.1 hypothetical protein DMH04_12265 [Kibdelosporangium aridum]
MAARTVLLDALEALNSHLPNIILVGAQAVYLHTGAGDLAQPPMTTDADLALDTSALAHEPEIAGTLMNAGFSPGKNPGSWLGRGQVAVDIMVVPWQSGTMKKDARAGRIPPHAKNTARITAGLEPALVDCAAHRLTALDPRDSRQFDLRVAGPAALLIAKAIKIEERLADADGGTSTRLKEKDALDMFRLLQAIETEDLVQGVRLHLADDQARGVTVRGLKVMETHGNTPRSPLPILAAQAGAGDVTIAPSFVALTQDLLNAVGKQQ